MRKRIQIVKHPMLSHSTLARFRLVTWELRYEQGQAVWRYARHQLYGDIRYPSVGEAAEVACRLMEGDTDVSFDWKWYADEWQDGCPADLDADELLVLCAEQTT